jgi:hypothetical protein
MAENLQQRKLSIIEQLARTSNKKVIEKVEVILKEDDFWNELPEEAKASINRGLNDLKNSRKKPHHTVMKNLRLIKINKWNQQY